MTTIDFSKIRPEGGSEADGFEEFCAQLFHRLSGVPNGSNFERFRGAGGDGGAEAVWRLPDGSVWAMQSKLFPSVRSGDRAKYQDSFTRALNNFHGLSRYFICVPFDPAPTVKEKADTTGAADKLKAWTVELKQLARDTVDRDIEIVWWFASTLKTQLLDLPNTAGRIRYWFDSTVLDAANFAAQLASAERLAGRRYTPRLQVGTDADLFLGAFGQNRDWLERTRALARRITESSTTWRRVTHEKTQSAIDTFSAQLAEISDILSLADRNRFDAAAQVRLNETTRAALATATELERRFKAEFDTTHGPDSDTPGFRQFMAEYMVTFPAANLDRAREIRAILETCVTYAEGWDGRASTEAVMVMRGPAGIGKTHAVIDTAKGRQTGGMLSVVLFGEELGVGQDPWRLLRAKLGMSGDGPRPELIGALDAAAEASGRPLVIFIDAMNETPDRKRWQTWLPDMITTLARPMVKLCLTCRDIYLDEVLGGLKQEIISYAHNGFVGREHEAATSFAAHYMLDLPANVIAQPEFANPLFLHLVCKAVKARGERAIPAGAIDLGRLVDVILAAANERAAERMGYDRRGQNMVRDGIIALGQRMAAEGTRALPLNAARTVLQGVWPSTDHERSLERALEAEDLIAVAELPTGWSVRFSFDRLGDLLVARALIENMDRAAARAAFATGPLAKFVANESTVAENAGLLQALSIGNCSPRQAAARTF